MFATNAPWLDVEKYAMRWGIETGYRMIENTSGKNLGCRRDPEDDLLCVCATHVQHVGVRKRRAGTIKMGQRTSHCTDHIFGDLSKSHVSKSDRSLNQPP